MLSNTRDVYNKACQISSVRQIIDGKDVFLLSGCRKEKAVWYYIRILPSKLTLLKTRMERQNLLTNLKQYGTILYKGWGDKPPISIELIIKNKYKK